jgi:hypothetical protein
MSGPLVLIHADGTSIPSRFGAEDITNLTIGMANGKTLVSCVLPNDLNKTEKEITVPASDFYIKAFEIFLLAQTNPFAIYSLKVEPDMVKLVNSIDFEEAEVSPMVVINDNDLAESPLYALTSTAKAIPVDLLEQTIATYHNDLMNNGFTTEVELKEFMEISKPVVFSKSAELSGKEVEAFMPGTDSSESSEDKDAASGIPPEKPDNEDEEENGNEKKSEQDFSKLDKELGH